MAIKVSIQNISKLSGGQGGFLVTGVLIPSGNYVTGGDTVDFTAAVADPALVGGAGAFLETSLPLQQFDAWSQAGNLVQGYLPVIGATQKTNKLKVVTAFGVELGAGAYPAGVLADNIAFMAVTETLL
jgi:hypothetical protein